MIDDIVMARCQQYAVRLYAAESVLSHESHARRLRRFLLERIDDTTPEGDALGSVVEFEAGIATYLSCGERAIVHALAVLLRLALAHVDHPDYREEWRPTLDDRHRKV